MAESSGRRRSLIFIALFSLALSIQLIRIFNVQSATGETPFLSANDRSRWCTILALAASGSYEIDDVIAIRDPKTNRRTWNTIDMVQHRGKDGMQHFYSSKPPLLPTLYAGVYWIVRNLSGATLTQQPFTVGRWMLVIVNLIPLALMWWIFSQWANQTWLSDCQYGILVAFALFGTYLSTFVVTLNNHLPAAVAVAISLVCIERIAIVGDQRLRWFALCGFATSFAASNELPALSWVAATGGLLLLANWKRTIVAYLPALLPIAIAFFGTNYLAHGTLRPAYTMRDVGALITTVEGPIASGDEEAMLAPAVCTAVIDSLRTSGFDVSDRAIVRKARREGLWELWDATSQERFAFRYTQNPMHTDASPYLDIYHWGDWYDYPGSYWTEDRKQGVDRGEPNALKYAIHCLVGHHGLLSLTPFWLLSLLGAVAVICGREMNSKTDSIGNTPPRWITHNHLLVISIVLVSIVVVGFYLKRPLEDRNYGGVTSGLRWAFWLIPLWYWLAARGMEYFNRREFDPEETKPSSVHTRPWFLGLVVGLLVISIYSATSPWNNPWTHPWLTRWIPL